MKKIAWALCFLLVGGFTFWGPALLVHLIRATHFSGIDVIVLTVIMPLVCFICNRLLIIGSTGQFNYRVAAVCVLVGVWLFGPLFLNVCASFTGRRERNWKLL